MKNKTEIETIASHSLPAIASSMAALLQSWGGLIPPSAVHALNEHIQALHLKAEQAREQAEHEEACRRAAEARSKLRTRILQDLDTYANEAEHQDGYAYWDQFKDTQTALDDFALYLANRRPPVEDGSED